MLALFQSPEIDKLGAALVQAQMAMPNITAGSSNPYFKSKYASLAEVRSATLPHLNAAGLAIIQPTRVPEGGDFLVVRTLLLHTSGQWLAGEYPVRFLVKAQEMGSAITYARRYGWMALCGQAPEDDDGNLAQEGTRALEARLAARTRVPQPAPMNPMKPIDAGSGSSGARPASPDPSGSGRPGGSSQVSARAPLGPDARAPIKRTPSEIEALIGEAANEGEEALEQAWETLTPEAQRHFEQAKARRYTPAARAVDAERAGPADGLEELLGEN